MTTYYSPEKGGFFDSTIHECLPADAVEISAERHAALLADQSRGRQIVSGEDGLPKAVPPQIAAVSAAGLHAAVQQHLDAVARAAGYDSMVAAVSYADEPAVPRFMADGKALRAWRSLAWSAAFQGMSAKDLPTAGQLLSWLPAAPKIEAMP